MTLDTTLLERVVLSNLSDDDVRAVARALGERDRLRRLPRGAAVRVVFDWTDVVRRTGLRNVTPVLSPSALLGAPDLVVYVDGVAHRVRAAAVTAGDRLAEEIELEVTGGPPAYPPKLSPGG